MTKRHTYNQNRDHLCTNTTSLQRPHTIIGSIFIHDLITVTRFKGILHDHNISDIHVQNVCTQKINGHDPMVEYWSIATSLN